jgi:hypothetical protein
VLHVDKTLMNSTTSSRKRSRSRSRSNSSSRSRSRSRSKSKSRSDSKKHKHKHKHKHKKAKTDSKSNSQSDSLSRGTNTLPLLFDDETTSLNANENSATTSILGKPFEWKAKKEKLLAQGLDPAKISKEQEQLRREELQREIEKLKKRREERELEKQRWEEERARLMREREMAANSDWEQKETEFHLLQTRLRCEKRLLEGRGTPFDLLFNVLGLDYETATSSTSTTTPDTTRNSNSSSSSSSRSSSSLSQRTPLPTHFSDLDLVPPSEILAALTDEELRGLISDIQQHLTLETSERAKHWRACVVLAQDLLTRRAQRAGPQQHQQQQQRDAGGVHQSVLDDITALLEGKTYSQLLELEQQINTKLNSGQALDEEYWHSVLQRLTVYKARALLLEVHSNWLTHKIKYTQQQQKLSKDELRQLLLRRSELRSQPAQYYTIVRLTLHRAGSLNSGPVPLTASLPEPVVTVASSMGPQLTEDEMWALEHAKGCEENEEVFNQDYPLPQKSELPASMTSIRAALQADHTQTASSSSTSLGLVLRKPRYFNRVRCGYEWNKYNQTHYDIENPPPKVVQGYKFNIFYPDLIDKTQTPQYFIEPSDNPDYVILRFHAGPPYQDIAFKIVNKEWEYSHKKGFKCIFSNGILHLWFNLKRYRYRR